MERPYIHINCASTLDGRISRPNGSRSRISSDMDMKRVHLLRAELGSIMVGAGTIRSDDPKLTVKREHVDPPPPLDKIIIDGRGRIDEGSRFLRTRGHSIILTTTDADGSWLDTMSDTIADEGLDAELLELEGDRGRMDLSMAMHCLHDHGIDKLLVEGGENIIGQLVSSRTFDLFTLYIGPMLMGGKGPGIISDTRGGEIIGLKLSGMERMGEGLLLELNDRHR